MNKRLRNEDETLEFGRTVLAKLLRPGDCVALVGVLGAGKTTLVRGILEGLGHQGRVRSPTFNLIQLYDLDVPVLHADLYRLQKGVVFDDLTDHLVTSITLIEWPDRSPLLPYTHRIHLMVDNDERELVLENLFE